MNKRRIFVRLDLEPCSKCGSTLISLEHEFSCDGYCAYCGEPILSPGAENIEETGARPDICKSCKDWEYCCGFLETSCLEEAWARKVTTESSIEEQHMARAMGFDVNEPEKEE